MSKEILGVFTAFAGIVLATYFSESCTNEILAQVMPILSTMPGLAVTYFARLSKGDVNAFGAKK